MTTLTSLLRPSAPAAAPAFRATVRFPAVRSLFVLGVSALVAVTFVLDVASGGSVSERSQPQHRLVQQASYLT